MTTIRKVSIAVAVTTVILILLSGLRAYSNKAVANWPETERDSLAALGNRMLEMCNQTLRGWRPEGFEHELAEIAEQAREDGARLREQGNKHQWPAYQDLADWADQIALFAGVAQRLGPDPGRPGYKDWDAEIRKVRRELGEAEASAFDPTLLRMELASTETMISAMTAADSAPEAIEQYAQTRRDEAHTRAKDTPTGKAARERADALRQKLDEMEAARPYTSIDIKPYLEDLRAAGEMAIISVKCDAYRW